MVTKTNLFIKTAKTQQYVLIDVSTFPPRSLLYGSNARANCELIHDLIANKTGGGTGRVIVDTKGVPVIIGPAGEYTFAWHVRDKATFARSGIYQCVINSAGFSDVTAPTITWAEANTSVTDVASPALSGTVNDASATIVVTMSGIDYPATNNGSTWSLAAGTLANIATSPTTSSITVSAIDNYGNISTPVTGTITNISTAYTWLALYEPRNDGVADGAAYANVHDYAGTANLSKTAGNGVNFTFSNANAGMYSPPTSTQHFGSTALATYNELFIVINEASSMSASSGLYVLESRTAANGIRFSLRNNTGATWRIYNQASSGVSLPGRTQGARQLIHIRMTDTTHGDANNTTLVASLNGGTEVTLASGTTSQTGGAIHLHDANGSAGWEGYYLEIGATASLSTAQRARVISEMKTKWGIA